MRSILARPAVQLTAILGAALLLRWPGLASMPLWVDESYTLGQAGGDLGRILRTRNTAHPPGYPLLAHVVLRLGGTDGWIRIPALVGGLAAIAVTFVGLRSVGRPRAAPVAALLLACSVYPAYYSQEARGYSWMTALAGAALFAAWLVLRHPGPRPLALALLLCLLAPGFHYLALPSAAAIVAILLAVTVRSFRSSDARVSTAAVWGAFGALGALAAFLLRERLATVADVAAVEATTRIRVDLAFLAAVLGRWSGLGVGSGPCVLAVVALGIAALARAQPAALALVLAVAGAPFAAVAAMSWPLRFESRYLMAALIPTVLLAVFGLGALAAGVLRLGERWGSRRAARALVVLGLVALLGAQVRVSARHAARPRKYTPATRTTPFGHRYVLFHDLLDPWMMRTVSTADFETALRRIGPIAGPLPDWELVPIGPQRPGEVSFLLKNDGADDTATFTFRDPDVEPDPRWRSPVVEPAQAGEGGERATAVRIRSRKSPVTGKWFGLVRLGGRFEPSGVELFVSLRTAREELGRRYLEDLAREIRYEPRR